MEERHKHDPDKRKEALAKRALKLTRIEPEPREDGKEAFDELLKRAAQPKKG